MVIQTIDDLIAFTTKILDRMVVKDEDVRQEVYLYVLTNKGKFLNRDTSKCEDDIEAYVVKLLITNEAMESSEPKKYKYDQFELYKIASRLIFNELDEKHRTGLIIKYKLDPAYDYNDVYQPQVVDKLAEEAITQLAGWAAAEII